MSMLLQMCIRFKIYELPMVRRSAMNSALTRLSIIVPRRNVFVGTRNSLAASFFVYD